MTYLIAIDQGTTSTRAIVFDRKGQSLANHQVELHQFFPEEGWVEHNAQEIWQSTVHCVQQAIANAKLTAKDIVAIGISNQRETTVIWDKETGEPIHHAIVWQDRRTAALCQRLKSQKGVEAMVSEKTGLLLDPYFSATKIAWLLGHIEGARAAADKGQLLFGTIESYLLWKMTGGKKHLTDATNASRTLLFNIHNQQWDKELLELFDIPPQLLPEVVDNVGRFGETLPDLFGESIAITGMAGDQQAATVGQACFQAGMLKSTYGTGCFMLLNTGNKVLASRSRLLSTIAYRINGEVTYGLEGSIFVAGAAIQWLRDNMGMVKHAADSEMICQEVSNSGGVYMVPAFTGMGAPYWDPEARAAILGMTRDTGVKHIVRAAVESVCYQSKDLLQAMLNDGADVPNTIRVDGGMVSNNWMLQFLADLLVTRVDRPSCIETSALGAAYLAGLGAGVYQNLDELSQLWQLDSEFAPEASREPYEQAYQGWLDAVSRVVGHHTIEFSQQPATLTE
ncbi:MAG: glycerol kinase GlpK [Coxiellaceae bacterium]|nr:glycerol kinase GlpK [Coxiellaceae bacterium]